ncbi:MAG: hypothetical protein OIF56_03675 [Cohaesibacter sp.]|nr:hypothetical protein [Cohaesibacter sp.]MCV6602052.1 hypothetical protein [Cohaesibacter sp.]
MKKLMLTIAAGFLLITTAHAAELGEGRRLAELAFKSADTADRDFIDFGEFITFGSDVFAAKDGNDDNKLTLEEFMNFDYGMQAVAEEKGRTASFDTALRVLFAFRDRNRDGLISITENRKSLDVDFRRADTDHDTVLTKEEFLNGFSVIMALKAAIAPEAK